MDSFNSKILNDRSSYCIINKFIPVLIDGIGPSESRIYLLEIFISNKYIKMISNVLILLA